MRHELHESLIVKDELNLVTERNQVCPPAIGL
jgi:hypothetical protein